VVLTVDRQRAHTATDDQTGELQDLSTTPQARITYTAAWYDGLGRTIASANVGTNGNTPYDRPDTVPARSDDVLLTTTLYNNAGQAYLMTDPAGRTQRQTFDALGRLVESVQNYIDGVVDAAHPDEDVTARRTYTADGQLATLTAVNPTTGDQTTQYLYGTTLCNSSIARSDLLRAEIYPDSTDSGDDASPPHANAAYDRVEYGYNRQGQVIRRRDQNQTLHVYDYDLLGRRVQDRVVELGSGVDSQIRRIAWTFDGRGRQSAITSYTHPCVGGGSIANQVVFQYNEANQVVAEYQQHAGAVDMSRTPQVQYQYDTAANGFRPTALVYPNGRTLYYQYDAGTDTALNRVSSLSSASSPIPNPQSLIPLVTYDYLGLNTIVRVIYPEPGLRWGLMGGSATDLYGRMDRFGRVIDHVWRNCDTATNVVEIQHGYDRVGNRLWRNDAVALAAGQKFDELYSYDGLNQLVSLNRGQLDETRTALVTDTKTFAEAWSLDMTGNWSAYQEDTNGDGTWDLSQTRTHDPANEITAISTTVGDSWISPTHDRNGNMTTIPSPLSPVTSLTCVYDAWNRLVRVTDGSMTVAEYQYDGRNFHIVKTVYSDGVLSEVRHFYLNFQNQVLEERVGTSTNADRQNVWGHRYVDDLVLRDRDTDSSGSLGERLCTLQDANWNVVALADTTGAAVERYIYSAYGKATIHSPDWSNTREASAFDNTTLYTGRELDVATGLYYHRARYYIAGVGTFVMRDPIKAGFNLYRYCSNSPIFCVDPDGLWGTDIHKDWTVRWAKFYFRTEAANIVGYGDGWVDEDPATSPITSAGWPYHFDIPTPAHDVLRKFNDDSRGREFNGSFARSTRLIARGECGDAFRRFGMALHPLQDCYAHGNWEPAVSNGLEAGIHPSWYDVYNRDGNTPAKIPIRQRDNRSSEGLGGMERRMMTHQHTRAAIEMWISRIWQEPCACLCWLLPQFRPKRCDGQADNPPREYDVPAIAGSGYKYNCSTP
jgi:RHS repeat-associated protein